MSRTKAQTLFKCATCGKEYSKHSSLRTHMETHKDKLHECDQCEKKYKLRRCLFEHKRTAHAEAGHFECEKCGKLCPHNRALRDHKRRVHSDEEFECPVCGKKLRLQSSSYHMETHNTGQQCECDVCGKICPHPSALANHKRNAHSEAMHRCEYCRKSFSQASDLRKHMAIHDDTRFICDLDCDLHSVTRSEYLEHLTRRHGKQHPATCKCAQVDVTRAQNVTKNLGNTAFMKAGGTMKCIDGDCDFATTCARQMESHKEQTHHDTYQPVLRCSSCGTWFTCPSRLKGHNADKHQGERRFKCADCGYITNVKARFTKHQTSCEQGTAMGNNKLKQAELTTENLDVEKDSPHAVYKFGSKIGEGGFGKVYEAGKKGENSHVKYAIKEVGPRGGHSAELEAKRMRQFEHKNLMALLEYYEWKEEGRLTRFIVMECCLPGSLTTMQKFVEFEELHVLYVLKEVTCGLEHLHIAGVIHRDLKSANVLVNERAEVKIADFGVSTGERIAFNCQGTRGWVAPEVAAAALTGITGLKSAYTQKADVYSVGVMSIDCFLPRKTLPTDFYHKKKVESESFAETQLQRIEEARNLQLSEAFKQLVTRCLAPMTTRLTAAAVQKVLAVKKASFETFKELVAECLKKQEQKRSARRCKARTEKEASSKLSSPTLRSGLAATYLFTSSGGSPQQPSTSGGMSSLFSDPAIRIQEASMSSGMSSLISAAPASTRQGQSTASSAADSLFSAPDDRCQQPSTPGGMSSLFSTVSSRPDH